MGFFDGGSKAAAFEQPGASVTGKVLAWKELQATDYNTNEPKFWSDGTPQMKVIVDLQTDERVDENDDGVRALHVSGKHSKRALLDALRRGGSKTPDEGGTLTMTYTGDDPQSKNPRQPAKMYSAKWVKPERPSQTFGTGQTTAAPQQATQAPQQAAQQPAADPWAPPGDDVEARVPVADAEKVRALIGMGVGLDDRQVSAATGVAVADVAALRDGMPF